MPSGTVWITGWRTAPSIPTACRRPPGSGAGAWIRGVGRGSYRQRSLPRYARVAQFADALGPGDDDVPLRQESAPGHTDPVGRPGEDEVARLQGADRRQVGDQGGDGEDQIAGAAVLHALARHVA